jgi:DnaJ-domain-containing protein 1
MLTTNSNFWKVFSIIFLCGNILKFISYIINFLTEKQKIKEEEFENNMNDFRKKMHDFEQRQREKQNDYYGKSNSYSGNYQNRSRSTSTYSLSDAYDLMDLKITDDVDIIKKKYRQLALKWHPDKWVNDTLANQKVAERNFQRLNNAYEVIKKYKNIV